MQVKEGDYLEAELVGSTLSLRPVTRLSPAEADRKLEAILSRITPLPCEPERSEEAILGEVTDLIREDRRHAEGGAR